MGYAGIQSMLISYKMRKADVEFHLMGITEKYTAKTRESDSVNEELTRAKNEISYDDPEYADKIEDLDETYAMKLSDIASWENKLQKQMEDDQVEIKQLDGYINSWQTALQSDVQKTHSYGPNASG